MMLFFTLTAFYKYYFHFDSLLQILFFTMNFQELFYVHFTTAYITLQHFFFDEPYIAILDLGEQCKTSNEIGNILLNTTFFTG